MASLNLHESAILKAQLLRDVSAQPDLEFWVSVYGTVRQRCNLLVTKFIFDELAETGATVYVCKWIRISLPISERSVLQLCP